MLNDLEQLLFACVLYDKGAGEVSEEIFSKIEATDLQTPKHQIAFVAMESLYKRGAAIDVATVTQNLNDMGSLKECGGVEYLSSLCGLLSSSVNYKHYITSVKEISLQKQYRLLCENIAKLPEGPSAQDLRSDLENGIARIAAEKNSSGLKHIIDDVDSEIERMTKAAKGEYDAFGIETGFSDLDKSLWGLRRGNLYFFSGRPGGGKTDIALNILYHAAVIKNKVCAFFSLEMQADEIVRRLLSIGGALDSTDILSGDIIKSHELEVKKVRNLIADGKLYINDTPNQSPHEIYIKCKKQQRTHGLDLIIIDYLGKIKPPRSLNNPIAETGEITRAVKDMARQLQVPVLCLCQLNRNSEAKDRRKSQEALMSDLRGSGEIEQEADVIVVLVPGKEPETDTRIIYLQMIKNRHGAMKNFKLTFQGNIHTFKEVASSITPHKPKAAKIVAPTIIEETELPLDFNDLFDNEL